MKVAVEFLTVPRDGEQENGDAVVVRHHQHGSLVAVIDALGHGARAATTAAVASRYITDAPIAAGLRKMIEGLHDALRGTRGAAAMVMHFAHGRLEGCGVGNVEVRGHNTRVPAVLTPGVLGGQMSRIKVFDAALTGRGRVVIFSDGISGRLALDDLGTTVAGDACRMLMERYRRPGDDATVLVTDFEAE